MKWTVLSVLLSMAVMGSSSHLSRSDAGQQITNAVKGKIDLPSELLLEVGHIESHCYGEELKLGDYDPVDARDKLLAEAGLIALKADGPRQWDISLTDLGKEAAKGEPNAHKQDGPCDYWQVVIPLAFFDRVEVSGVAEDGPHAKVDALIEWKPTPTAFALKSKLSSDQIDSIIDNDDLARMPAGATEYKSYRSFAFTKYDDGWRLDSE